MGHRTAFIGKVGDDIFGHQLKQTLEVTKHALAVAKEHGIEHLSEEQLREMLTFANAAASIVTTRKGALRVMPEAEEIYASLR